MTRKRIRFAEQQDLSKTFQDQFDEKGRRRQEQRADFRQRLIEGRRRLKLENEKRTHEMHLERLKSHLRHPRELHPETAELMQRTRRELEQRGSALEEEIMRLMQKHMPRNLTQAEVASAVHQGMSAAMRESERRRGRNSTSSSSSSR